MPTLYLVATPIGNLEDITLRALRILRECSLIAAEDSRKTQRLLARYDIHTPLTCYFEHSKVSRIESILDALRQGDVALVSEAGMPGISDPGYDLVRAAIDGGVPVVSIPGASAPVAALAASGLPTDRFLYLGFLPRHPFDRRKLLAGLAAYPHTLVAFEAPHRLVAALDDIAAALGGSRRLSIAREMTKLHEETLRLTAAQATEHFRATPPRGEFTLVIAGASAACAGPGPYTTFETPPPTVDPAQRLRRLTAGGASVSDAVKQVARECGLPRREVYRLALGTA